MKQISQYEQIGTGAVITPERKVVLGDLIDDLGLDSELAFSVLVNGKKGKMDDIVGEDDEVTVIPQIRGGY